MQQWLIPAKGKKTMTKTNQTRQISRRLTCQVISYLNGSHLLLLLKSILCQPHNHSILSHQIKNLKIKWLESNFRFINIVGLYPWTSWWRIKSFIIYKKWEILIFWAKIEKTSIPQSYTRRPDHYKISRSNN